MKTTNRMNLVVSFVKVSPLPWTKLIILMN